MRFATLLLFSSLAPALLTAQATRAERTHYAETSSYADVMAFLDSLDAHHAGLRRWTMATSPSGKPVPVVLAARPMVASPAEAHRSGKPIVYLQANIHAGEVEGKEAAQMLLRDLTLGPLRPLLDRVILLVVPIYNVDGNDAFGPEAVNRPEQNGPAIVGRRENGQGLDLNRDYVKMEAPETRGSIALINEWRPDFFLDLHTTDGSYHGYALTFAPGLNANHNPPTDYIQNVFLPEIRRRMRARHHEETFPYGNFRNQDPDSLGQGWETYDGRARYGTNWFALRGGFSILSEAYSHDPFERRVRTTYDFVHEILDLLVERWPAMRQVEAERPRPDSVALQQEFAPPRMEPVIAEITLPDSQGSGGFARRKPTGRFVTVTMPVWDRFAARESAAVPAAYLIPASLDTVVALLRAQGVVVDSGWTPPAGARLEVFTIDSVSRARRSFQRHREVQLTGAWAADTAPPTGTWFHVSTAQPLGLFAAYLLEPASEDGLVDWNFEDAELAAGGRYPILRIR